MQDGSKRAMYGPSSLQRCQRLVCSRQRAVVFISVIVGIIFLIAFIAAVAHPSVSNVDCTSGPSALNGSLNNKNVSEPLLSTNGKPFPWPDIRLPKTVMPLTYKLFIHPNLSTFLFNGNVTVTFSVREATDVLLFHVKTLNISSYEVYEMSVDGKVVSRIEVTEALECVQLEQFHLQLASSVFPEKFYELRVVYSGRLTDSLTGFYRSSYETSSGEKRWLATTHFEPTDARAAFPCFDEPDLKANFTLSMVRKPHQISLFNTEKVGEEGYENGQLHVDHFATSVKMSTYLVAFVVCDFANRTKLTKTGVRVSVYAPPELIDQTEYALNIATSVLDFYESYFGVSYPLTKSDHIAIPDFAAGAMENWGLITYLMRSLLYKPNESSARDKHWVALVVAHELAHQWFGNLVTMKWWNDLWLNEGFARYVECVGTDHAEPDFHMMDQFVYDALHVALYSDGLSSSHPISVPVNDPSEIGEIFDSISYEKGASIIRMLESVLGNGTFLAGLHLYLARHQYSNAETHDLWTAMTEQYQKAGVSEASVEIKEVMDTWTLQMGYPVVSVTRSGTQLSATQQRFLYNPRANHTEQSASPFGYKWYVPLTYVTSSSPRMKSPVVWMKKSGVTFSLEPNTNPQWIKLNANMTGVYRVHYDDDNWRALITQMKQDHSVFSVADRAGLLSDAFALARSGQLDVTVALEMSEYLVSETELVPWRVAIDCLSYISGLLEGHPDYRLFKTFMKRLTKNTQTRLGWQDIGSQSTKLLRAEILRESVMRGDDDSVAKVQEMFSNWMKHNSSISANLKTVVYVGGVKYGGDAEWQFVWNQFVQSRTPSEKSKLRAALSASTDVLVLNRLLQLSLNESVVRVSETPRLLRHVAYNPAGRILAWRFVRSHWKILYDRYRNVMMKMRRVIKGVTGHFTTQFDFDEVNSFFSQNLGDKNSRSVSQALEQISLNIDWLSRNEQKVLDWLRNMQHV